MIETEENDIDEKIEIKISPKNQKSPKGKSKPSISYEEQAANFSSNDFNKFKVKKISFELTYSLSMSQKKKKILMIGNSKLIKKKEKNQNLM